MKQRSIRKYSTCSDNQRIATMEPESSYGVHKCLQLFPILNQKHLLHTLLHQSRFTITFLSTSVSSVLCVLCSIL